MFQIALIFATSRGCRLGEFIKSNGEARVFFIRGGRIEKIKREARYRIKQFSKRYSEIHVYFLVGIPDLTNREVRHAYEEVTFTDNPQQKIKEMKEIFLGLSETIKRYGCKVCICTLPPMSLSKWNFHRLFLRKTSRLLHKDNYITMQRNLEKSVIDINKHIIELNISNQMVTPFISDTILKKTKKGLKRQYSKFPDGLHPGVETYAKWGELISARIDLNFAKHMEGGAQMHIARAKYPSSSATQALGSPPHKKRSWKTY